MLSDNARRILITMGYALNRHGRMPTLPLLERLTGRFPAQIHAAMRELAAAHRIEWNSSMPVETARIIDGWGQGDDLPSQASRPRTSAGYVDYWTQY